MKIIIKKLCIKILIFAVISLVCSLCFLAGRSYQKIKTMAVDSYTVSSIEFWEAFFNEEALSRDMQARLDALNSMYE